MKVFKVILAIFISLLLITAIDKEAFCQSTGTDPTLYGLTDSGTLYTIDISGTEATGKLVGQSSSNGLLGCTAMDFLNNTTLYAFCGFTLYTIDTTTGVATRLNTIDSRDPDLIDFVSSGSFDTVEDISFNNSGTLYAYLTGSAKNDATPPEDIDRLVTVDLISGNVFANVTRVTDVIVPVTTTNGEVTGREPKTDAIAVSPQDNKLYYVQSRLPIEDSKLSALFDDSFGSLHGMSLTTDISAPRIVSMDFNPETNVLYALVKNGDSPYGIATINTAKCMDSSSPVINCGAVTIQKTLSPDLMNSRLRAIAWGPGPTPQIVNKLVHLDSLSTDFVPPASNPQPEAPAGTFTLFAKFRNISTSDICNPFFEVVELEGGNRLTNVVAIGPPPQNTNIPIQGLDGVVLNHPPVVLKSGETNSFFIVIGLKTTQRFRFFVDMKGIPQPSGSPCQ